MVSYDRETLFRTAQWATTSKRRVGRKIRELAGNEETCTLILTELYRIEGHLRHARTLRVQSSLTLVEWFRTLEYFHWECSYCQMRPFQILHHFQPQEVAGTTITNCVPACRHCRSCPTREWRHVQSYLTTLACTQVPGALIEM